MSALQPAASRPASAVMPTMAKHDDRRRSGTGDGYGLGDAQLVYATWYTSTATKP